MTISFCLAPAIGAALGALFLREKLMPIQWVGVMLCIAGAALVTYYRQQ